MEFPASRFYAAKRTVDDRALDKDVFRRLLQEVPQRRLQVLEIGAGLGTMVARLVEWGLLRDAEYTLLDVDAELLAASREWLSAWAEGAGHRFVADRLTGEGLDVRVRFVQAELAGYLEDARGPRADLLVANAVLDLVEVPVLLPRLLALVEPGGLYWFTINFDGATIFEPEHPRDDAWMALYHRTMDERVRYGRPAGHSRTGRRLFAWLREAGASVLAAGASDWVVHPPYVADEAWFLRHILHFVEEGLRTRPEVDPAELAEWVALRESQIQRGELVYLAHQLDFVGRVSAAPPAR